MNKNPKRDTLPAGMKEIEPAAIEPEPAPTPPVKPPVFREGPARQSEIDREAKEGGE